MHMCRQCDALGLLDWGMFFHNASRASIICEDSVQLVVLLNYTPSLIVQCNVHCSLLSITS